MNVNSSRRTTDHGLACLSRIGMACAAAVLCWPAQGAGAAVFKCVDATGKTTYQGNPCDSAVRESTLAIVPAPPPGPARKASAAPRSTTVSREATPQELEQARIDARGPRETWNRLGQALDRGDIESALRELTLAAQQRFRPVFETVIRKSKSFRFSQLGTVRSIQLIGKEVATITVARDKPDGTFGYEAMLIRGPDGKWLIDGM